ncbi:MAG TPA: methyl-accepting chemotaxis protein [Bacillota bacterium]|nr:methyl-accepting chemotaxis protein [Bacillota bacterium]
MGIIKPIYISEKLFYPALIAQVLISSALIMAQYFLSLKTNRLFNDLVDKEEREQLLNSLKITLEKLNETFVVLNSSTQQFSASTEEVSQAVSRIADSSGNVFEQIKKANEKSLVIVDTSNELAAFAEEIAANSEQADKIMHDTQEIAVIEEQKVVQFSGKMTAIYDKVAQMYESIKTLEENARKINDINVIIQGITKKTNLLSLNAAIEAARAGEYGKSFAVVAKEIQDLASASANSSENITATLNSIHDQNLSILADLQQSVEVLKNGVEIVQNTGVSLGKIKDSCQSSSGMISEISAGNQREAEAINRITIYLNEISDTIKSISLETEDIASGSEETSASIQEIAASAEQLAVTANGISGIIDTINYKSL